MSPNDLLAAYLRWLPHEPMLSREAEAKLAKRIALGKIRMRWAISQCEIAHRAAVTIAQEVLAGILKPEDVVDLREQPDPLPQLSEIIMFSGDAARVSRLIRRTPFLERHWQEFTREIRLAASDDASLRRTLQQILRGREDAETAAQRLIRANLRPAAGYATQYMDPGPDLVRAAKLALIRAAHTFDHRSGRAFFLHAKPFIYQATHDATSKPGLHSDGLFDVSPPPTRRVN